MEGPLPSTYLMEEIKLVHTVHPNRCPVKHTIMHVPYIAGIFRGYKLSQNDC